MGGGDGVSIRTLDVLDEDGVSQDTVDVSRVITEEDTAEGGKGADHVGLEGYGSLDTVDIVGGLEDDGGAGLALEPPGVDIFSFGSHIGESIWTILMRIEERTEEWQGNGKLQERGNWEFMFTCLLVTAYSTTELVACACSLAPARDPQSIGQMKPGEVAPATEV